MVTSRKVAIVLSDGFNAEQYQAIREFLLNKGMIISVVGEQADAKLSDLNKQIEVPVEINFDEARSYDFDAVIIPDGFSPDKIRINSSALAFIKEIYEDNKPIGVIDHGVQVLITLDVLKNKNITASPSLEPDLKNAGAKYFNEPVVVDANIISGRGTESLKEFCETFVDELQRQFEEAA